MKKILVTALLLIGSQSISAGIINFEDTPPTGWYQHSIQSGDFQVDKNGGWMGVNNYHSWLPLGAYNSTQDLDMGYGTFDLYQLSGESFNLNSLDAGLSWYNYDSTDEFTITGYQSNGSIVSVDLTLSHDYQNFLLDSFTDLNKVTFSGHAIDSGYVVIDNLDVSAASVPEPFMLPLMTIGLAGLMFTRRQRKRTCT